MEYGKQFLGTVEKDGKSAQEYEKAGYRREGGDRDSKGGYLMSKSCGKDS